MKVPTYHVNKENVYIGQVVKSNASDHSIVLENGKLSIYSFIPYRSMIFTLTEDKRADDLLYDSDLYPVLNISNNQDCLKENVFIRGAYNLEALLTFFCTPNILSLTDIQIIRKYFFSGPWGYDHAHLFGFREVMPEDWTYVQNGAYVTDAKELKQLQQREYALRKRGHRVFEQMDEGAVLPPDMMYIFSEFGDHSIMDVLQGFEKRRNAFKPDPEEGKVKKLHL